MPSYLTFFKGISRLRSCRLDKLSYVSSIFPRGLSANNLNKAFLYRTHLLCNNVPPEVKEFRSVQEFKCKIIKYLWKLVSEDLQDLLDNSCLKSHKVFLNISSIFPGFNPHISQ